MIDGFGREIDYLRISITDRCNLRCRYCMPEHGVAVMRHDDILRYEEILRIVRIMRGMGVCHLRVTGGEPMARRGCLDFVRELRGISGIESVSMTSNGLLLCDRVQEAKEAGLTGLNLSLDTLDPDIYAELTRGGDVRKALRTLTQAIDAGISTKVNAVPIRDRSEDAVVSLALLAKDCPVCVRFIELMPIGCARTLRPIPQKEIAERLTEAFGALSPDTAPHGHGPACYVKPQGFCGSIGFISALTHEFCDSCNRVRLTADGQLKLCLNRSDGLDLRALLRGGADDKAIEREILEAIARKPERHAFNETIRGREARRMNEIGG